MLKIGDRAPDFSLPDRNAQKVHLSNHFGRWVILYFYPRDNSPGCTMEAKEFSEHLGEFEDLNAVVIGVSPDSVRSHYTFARNNNLNILLLSDRQKKVMEQYGSHRMKSIYGKETPTVVRSTFLINPGGNIAYIWDNVRVKGHVQEVMEKLKELKAKRRYIHKKTNKA